MGEWANGRMGEWANGRMGEVFHDSLGLVNELDLFLHYSNTNLSYCNIIVK